MASSPLREACRPDCTANGALNHRRVKVVASLHAGASFTEATCGWKNPLPGPLSAGARVFSPQSTGQFHVPEAVIEVQIVSHLGPVELMPQSNGRGEGKHRVSFPPSLCTANDDFPSIEIKILDA